MQKRWISFTDLAQMVGRENAERLCADYGGRALYVPVAGSEEHFLEEMLGRRFFRKLWKRYGGFELFLPNLLRNTPKKQEILVRLGQGEPPKEIAASLNVTERWVRILASRHGVVLHKQQAPA